VFKNFYSEKKEGRKATNSLFKLGVIFSITFLFLFSLNLISASEDNAGDYSIHEQFTFTQPCSDATYVTLSLIKTPSQTIIIDENMTLIATKTWGYNYTPSELGKHFFEGKSDGCEGSYATYINIKGGDIGLFLIIIGVSLVLLLFAFLFKSPWLSFASGALMIISGLYVMGYGLYFYSDLYTRSIAYTLIGIGLFFAIISGFEVFQEDW
jgi:hypothetical protein